MRPFVKLKITIDADLILGGKTIKHHSKRAILIAPERKHSADLLQEGLITSAGERLIDLLDEINYEHEKSKTPEG